MKIHFKRFILTSSKWLFSGAMLVYILHEIDLPAVQVMLREQNPLVLLAVLALLILQLFIATFRWQRITYRLSHKSVMPHYRELAKLNFISVFFNNCLPGTIGGDVVRAMLLRSEKLPLTLTVHSVIIDRLVAILGIVSMVIVGMPWLKELIPTLPVWSIFLIITLMAVAGILFIANVTTLLGPYKHRRMVRLLLTFVEHLRLIVFSLRDFLIMLMQATAGHACFCLACALLANSLGAMLSFANSLLLIPPVLLLMMLPISVGGWGVREISMVGMLAYTGITKEVALTVGIQMGILQIMSSLPGAWLYANRRLKRS